MRTKNVIIILGIITALAFFLRVHGINYYSYGDEAIQVYYSLRLGMLKMLPVNFHRIALCAFYGVFFLFGWVVGIFHSLPGFINAYFSHQHVFYFTGRLFESLAGAACIPAMYWAGKSIYDRTTGLLSALFLAVCYVYVEISQIARGQALAAFLLLLALGFGCFMRRRGLWRDYMLAWACGGAAASIFSYCGVIAIPLFILHFLGAGEKASAGQASGRGMVWGRVGRGGGKLLLGMACGVAVYALSAPEKIIFLNKTVDIALVKTGVLGKSELYFFGTEVGNSWKFYLVSGFSAALGWNLLGVVFLGIVYNAIRPRWRIAWVLLGSSLIFFLVLGKGQIASRRYLFPILPWLLLPGAQALREITRQLPVKNGFRQVVLVAVALLIAVPQAKVIYREDIKKISKSTKNLAEEWILNNLPLGTRIAVENMGYTGPDLKFTPIIDHWMYNLSEPELKKLYRQRREEGLDSFALKYFIEHPPEKKYYIRTISIKDEIMPEDMINESYQYVVINSLSWNSFRSPSNRGKYPEYTSKRLAFYDWLEREGELVQSFKPDAETPGQEIKIYKIKQESN